MMPFNGKAHVAYMPVERVVGLSKLARLVDVYARRLQTQEHLTSQIATAIDEILKPRGVAVMIEAEHTCMSLRGVEKPGALDRHDAVRRRVPRRPERAGALHHHGARRRQRADGCKRDSSPDKCAALRRRVGAEHRRRPALAPKFDADGLVTCVATDAGTGEVLMVAHMNAEALAKTHRDRRGLVLQPLAPGAVEEGRDLRPHPARRRDAGRLRPGRGLDQGRADGAGACHTGRRSCFYRAVPLGQSRRGGARIPRRREGVRSRRGVRSTE